MHRSLISVAILVSAAASHAFAGDVVYHTGRAAYSTWPAGSFVDVAFNDGNGANHFASETYIFYGDTLGQTVTHWFNYRWLDSEAEPLNTPGEFRLGISHRPGGDPNANNSGMYDPHDGTAENVPVNAVLIQLGTYHGRTIINPVAYITSPTITQFNDTTVLYEWAGEGPDITDITYHVDKGVSVTANLTTYVTINPQRPTIVGNAPSSGGGASGVINPGGFGGGASGGGGAGSANNPLGQGLPKPTDGQGNELKVVSQKPGRGGDTIDLNNITPDTGRDSVTIIIEYKVPDILPQDLVAESLRMFFFDQTSGQFDLAGTNNMGLASPTNALGDYGVNIIGDKVQVWTNINHASTYVVAGEVVPEPASLALLSICSVALLRRRR